MTPKTIETVIRTIPCRLCGYRVIVNQGLDEMAEHWHFAHPIELEKLRSQIGTDEEPRET